MGKFGSFLLGGAIGAGIAILFAPRSGVETRALIAEKADECCGKGQTWYDQGKTYVQEGVAGVQPTINKKSDELRQKIENARALIAEQVAKNASAARDVINDKVPVAAEKINQAADVVRGRIDEAADILKAKTAGSAVAAGEDGAQAAAEAAAPQEAAAPPEVVAPVGVAVEAPAEAPDKVEPAAAENA